MAHVEWFVSGTIQHVLLLRNCRQYILLHTMVESTLEKGASTGEILSYMLKIYLDGWWRVWYHWLLLPLNSA